MKDNKKAEKLVNRILDYVEKNMSEVLLDYIIMTWFIGQDPKREIEFKKVMKEIKEQAEELNL